MRGLTQEEIDQAPEWANEYVIAPKYGNHRGVCYVNINTMRASWFYKKENVFDIYLTSDIFIQCKTIPRKEFDFTKYVFECTRLLNDTEEGEETISVHTPNNTAKISRNDTIAAAKFYKLTGDDLK